MQQPLHSPGGGEDGAFLDGLRNRPRPVRAAMAADAERNRLRDFRDVLALMRAEAVEDPFRAAMQFMRANPPPSVLDAVRQRFGAAAPQPAPNPAARTGSPPGLGPQAAPAPAAPATPGYLAFGNGVAGPADKEVAALQVMLNATGAKIAVDGRFGPQTELALYRFQKRSGIDVDGVAGPQTMKALTGTIAATARRDQALAAQQARIGAPADPRDRWPRPGGPPARPVNASPAPAQTGRPSRSMQRKA